ITAALGATLAVIAMPGTGYAYLTGIGDDAASMFASPDYQALHTRIARYIAPYDVADSPIDRYYATTWIHAAEVSGVQPLIAFYHSRITPTRMPSVAKYTREVKRFMALF